MSQCPRDEPPGPRTAVTAAGSGLGAITDRDPLEFHDRLRAAGDIVWDEAMDGWIVSSYELIKQVYVGDDVDWQSDLVWNPDEPPLGLSEEDWIRMNFYGSWRSLQALEGPGHDRQHRWWLRAFSPKALAEWGDRLIEPIALEQISTLAPAGRAELHSGYCEPVTTRSMAAILGLPYDDPEWFARFRDLRKVGVEAVTYPPGKRPPADLMSRFEASSREIYEMAAPSVLRAREAENHGFVDMVWRDAEYLYGKDFRVEDVVTAVIQAFFGATGTTSAAGGNLFYLLLTTPGLQQGALAGGTDALRQLVEESLRLYPAVEFRTRRAKRDLELGVTPIKKGQLVILENGAANRDGRRYDCPASADLARRAPRDHFTFSQGPRTCPGVSLARFLLERMLTVALEHMHGLRLDASAEQPRYLGNAARAWKPLNVLFEADATQN